MGRSSRANTPDIEHMNTSIRSLGNKSLDQPMEAYGRKRVLDVLDVQGIRKKGGLFYFKNHLRSILGRSLY